MAFKLNPLTAKLDLVSIDDENFSYNNITEDNEIEIPENQQMIVYNTLSIDGSLVINGDLVILDDKVHNRITEEEFTSAVNVELFEVIKQISSGITTSLDGVIKGSKITIVNSSLGTNTLNLTIQGVVSPTIFARESYSIMFNGIDWDIL